MRNGGSCSLEESDWTILTQTPPPGCHKNLGMNSVDLTIWKGTPNNYFYGEVFHIIIADPFHDITSIIMFYDLGSMASETT